MSQINKFVFSVAQKLHNFHPLTFWNELITGKTSRSISLDYSRVEIAVVARPDMMPKTMDNLMPKMLPDVVLWSFLK